MYNIVLSAVFLMYMAFLSQGDIYIEFNIEKRKKKLLVMLHN